VPDRAVVVGGGVVGCATALELAERGFAVTLVEANGIASGVSGGSLAALTRHLAADPEDVPFISESVDRWGVLAETLRHRTGIDVEHEVSGQLSLVEAGTPERAAEAIASVRETVERERKAGLEVELVNPGRARTLVPALAGSRVVGATWCPGDAKINALLACRALAHAAARAGVRVRTGERVLELTPVRGRWALRTSRGSLPADVVVVAAGPWTAQLVAPIDPRLRDAIAPKRAQCCVTDALPPLIGPVVASISVGISTGYTQLHQTRSGQVMFNTVTHTEDPRLADGRLDDRVDHDFLVTSARTLVDLFPALARARLLRSWASCEGWTADRRFLIGQVGPQEALFVAAGDSGVGFLQAPMVARAVGCLVTGEECGHDLTRYSPLRALEVAA
jgi:sarcosine oxidase, subunit beta